MTEEQKNVVIKCRNSGLGYGASAKKAGLTKDAVVAFCRRNSLTGNMAGKVPEGTGSRCKECGAALVQAEGIHIRHLREKLYEAEPDAPFTIRCVREVGYCFEVSPE